MMKTKILPLNKDDFKQKFLSRMENLPLDVYHSFLLSTQFNIGITSDLLTTSCPKCLLPYNKRCYQNYILSHPRKKSLVRTLLWREKTRKTSHKDKCLISAYRNQHNVFVFHCKRCGYKRMMEMLRPQIKKQNTKTDISKNQSNDIGPVKKQKIKEKKSLKSSIKIHQSFQPPNSKENKSNANELRKESYKDKKTKVKKGKITMKPKKILKKNSPLCKSGSKKVTPRRNKKKAKNLQNMCIENSSSSKQNCPSLSSFLKTLI